MRLNFWTKTIQAATLAVAVCLSLGASDASSRYNSLGHRIMCTCGCAQLLGECDHVGCPSREQENQELKAAIIAGGNDKQILDSFAAKYGATVRAAPTMEGFDLVAWIAPFAVFGAALLGTILLVRRWSIGKGAVEVPASDPATNALKEKIRRETGDGGF